MKYLKLFNENLNDMEFKIESDIEDILVEFKDDNVDIYVTCNLEINDFLLLELIDINNVSKDRILDSVERIKDYLQDISKNIIVKYSPSFMFTEDKSILSDILTDYIMDYGNDELFIVFYKK